jgi:hypothetical protein
MPAEYKFSDAISDVIDRHKDVRPTEGEIYGIDGDRVDVRLNDSVAIVRHVEVVGNLNDVDVGDTVQLVWGMDGRPVVMLIGSGGGGGTTTVVADNQSIENSSSGLRVKQAGILRHHLGFALPDETEFIDLLAQAGWQIDPITGTIFHDGIRISPSGEISLGSGEDVIKMSGTGSPDDPNTPFVDETEYRLWIGATLPYNAPFTVDKFGNVNISSGVIGGWSMSPVQMVSDAGNATLHAGARPFVGMGTDVYGGTGFWAGKDTDYIYKVSIGEAGGPQLTYDGTDLTLQDIDLKFYYGTNFTLWIQSDGDFAIGQDIDTVSETSLRIFSNDQTYDGEAFTAGDIIIGDHGGAHMTWDQSAGQLQFRDGSVTGTPTRAYMDTDGSIMFGDGQGRLDDTGILLEASADRDAEYYWNSLNWMTDLGLTSESLAARISGADAEVWIHVLDTSGRISLGVDADLPTGESGTAWQMVYGANGGEFWNWSFNETLDGVVSTGTIRHVLMTSPFTSAPQAGFGHRTAWYLQDGASSFSQAAYMDVIWEEGWGGAEPGSAFSFFVFPDASMTEMFRIGSMPGVTTEDPYAAVVNPQSHSEGNFLVMGASNSRMFETDSGTNEIFIGASNIHIEVGGAGTPTTGFGTLYHNPGDNLLYWYDGSTAYNLTVGGSAWTDAGDYLWTSDDVAIGANADPYTGNALLVTDSFGGAGTGWSPAISSYANVVIESYDGLAGITLATPDDAAGSIMMVMEFEATAGNYAQFGAFSPSHSTTPYEFTLLHSGYGFNIDTQGGNVFTANGNTNAFSFEIAGTTGSIQFNSGLKDMDLVVYGDTKEVFRVDATDDLLEINNHIQLVERAAPGTPASGYGYLYASSSTSDLHWITDGGTDYNLTDTSGGSEWTDDAGGFLYPTEIADAVVIGAGASSHGGNAWIEIAGGGYSGSSAPMGIHIKHSASGASVNDVYGTYSTPGWGDSTNTLGDLFGHYTNLWAIAAGDVTNAYGYWGSVSVAHASQVLSNYYGIYLAASAVSSGSLTTSTALLIEDDTAPGTFYAVDVEGGTVLFNSDLTDSDLIIYGDVGEVFRVDAGLEVAQISTWLELKEVAAPTTGEPGTGWGAVYAKTDGKIYFKNDGGTEYDLTSGVGGGEWTDDTGGFLYPTETGDSVVIGSATLTGSYILDVTGDTLLDGDLHFDGTQEIRTINSGDLTIKPADGRELYLETVTSPESINGIWAKILMGDTIGGVFGDWGISISVSDTDYVKHVIMIEPEQIEFNYESVDADVIFNSDTSAIVKLDAGAHQILFNSESITGLDSSYLVGVQSFDSSFTGSNTQAQTGFAMGDFANSEPTATWQYLDYVSGGWKARFNIVGMNAYYDSSTDQWELTDSSHAGAYMEVYSRYDTEGTGATDIAEYGVYYIRAGTNTPYTWIDAQAGTDSVGPWLKINSSKADVDFVVFGDVDEVFRVDAGLEIAQISTWLELQVLATGDPPATGEPGTGWGAIYVDTDTELYYKDDSGNTYNLGQPALNNIAAPTANSAWAMTDKQLKLTWTNPSVSDGALELEVTGAFTGDVLHIHQHTGNPGATDLVHLEADDVDVLLLRVSGAGSLASFEGGWLELEELTTGELPTTGEPGTGFGAVYIKASDGKIHFKDDSGTEYDLTSGGTGEWTESGGYLTQLTGSDIVQIQNYMELEEVATPTTGNPGTGFGALYAKTDGHIHYKNDSGTEYDLTDTGVGGGAEILEVQVFM